MWQSASERLANQGCDGGLRILRRRPLLEATALDENSTRRNLAGERTNTGDPGPALLLRQSNPILDVGSLKVRGIVCEARHYRGPSTRCVASLRLREG